MRLLLRKPARFTVLGFILILVSLPGIALADSPIATKITLNVEQSANFGQTVPLNALLVDASGVPISGARVKFVVPSTFFLGTTSDVVIAEVATDKQGVAEAQYDARDTGWLSIRAEFPGSDRYVGAKTTSQIMVDGRPRQLYVPHVGVQVPGLNAPPLANAGLAMSLEASPATSGFGGLWPAMSAWPIGLVLLIIWSLYALAVRQVFRIAKEGVDRVAISQGGRSHRLIAGGAEDEFHPDGVPALREEGLG